MIKDQINHRIGALFLFLMVKFIIFEQESLLAEGIIFETTGDTEVLARALIKWGIDKTLDKLEEWASHSTIKICNCICAEIVLVKNPYII